MLEHQTVTTNLCWCTFDSWGGPMMTRLHLTIDMTAYECHTRSTSHHESQYNVKEDRYFVPPALAGIRNASYRV